MPSIASRPRSKPSFCSYQQNTHARKPSNQNPKSIESNLTRRQKKERRREGAKISYSAPFFEELSLALAGEGGGLGLGFELAGVGVSVCGPLHLRQLLAPLLLHHVELRHGRTTPRSLPANPSGKETKEGLRRALFSLSNRWGYFRDVHLVLFGHELNRIIIGLLIYHQIPNYHPPSRMIVLKEFAPHLSIAFLYS